MMQLLNPIRRWYWRVKLGAVLHEIDETFDEMRGALYAQDTRAYWALADWHTQLTQEAQQLRLRLASTPTTNR